MHKTPIDQICEEFLPPYRPPVFILTDLCITAGGDLDRVTLSQRQDDKSIIEWRQDFAMFYWQNVDFTSLEQAMNFCRSYYKDPIKFEIGKRYIKVKSAEDNLVLCRIEQV